MLIKSKSKSFDLINEEKTTKPQQPERLYQPRRMSWLKYIVIPTGIGFILLLILCNVDFSVNQQETVDDNNSTNSTIMALYNLLINRTIGQNDDYFKLQCLETEEVTLHIETYNFSNGVIYKNFLQSEIHFEHLIIENSNVSYIDNGAFENLENLKSLQLLNLPIRKLAQKTFFGLWKLENFTLISSGNLLIAQRFLKPFATTILNISLHFKNKRKIEYYFEDIFDVNIIYTNLKVLNLKDTQLGDSLSNETFNNMPKLEYLNLVNCGLKSIESNTLAGVFDTLKYLDLSENNITILNEDFMLAIWANNINLETFDEITGTTQQFVGFTAAVRTTTSTTTEAPITSPPTTLPTILPTTLPTTEPITETTTESTTDPTTIESTTVSLPECPEDSIYCAKFICSNQEYAIPYQVNIKFEDNAENYAVNVTLYPFDSDLFYLLIYFNNDMQSNAKTMETQTLQLDSLDCATSYTFCVLIYENSWVTSPYNCRSHRTLDCRLWILNLSWFQEYFMLIICLGVVGILISVSLGILLVYIVLRLKPNLLRGSKRLIQPLRDSQTMFLLPRLSELANPNMRTKDYDYIDYYRRLELAKGCRTVSNKDYMPPKDRAPSIPPSVTSSENTLTTPSTSYLYETFELYEELP